jgi:hypothetical protein
VSKEINRVEWGMYYKKIFKLYDVYVREIYRLSGKVKPSICICKRNLN